MIGGLEIIGAAIVAIIAAFVGGQWRGRRAAERAQEAKEDAEYRETREKVDKATGGDPGRSDSDNAQWLSARSKRKP